MKNYVKKYMGHDVPEGATHYIPESRYQRVGFYKWENGQLMFKSVALHPQWVNSIKDEIPTAAVELQEEPMPSKAEWVNGVPDLNSEVLLEGGEEYLFSASSNEMFRIAEDEVLIVVSIGARHDNGNPVVTVMAKDSKNIGGYTTVNPDFLSPLKTAEEKKREAFINTAIRLIDTTNVSISQMDIVSDVINQLADKGFTAPEGEL